MFKKDKVNFVLRYVIIVVYFLLDTKVKVFYMFLFTGGFIDVKVKQSNVLIVV